MRLAEESVLSIKDGNLIITRRQRPPQVPTSRKKSQLKSKPNTATVGFKQELTSPAHESEGGNLFDRIKRRGRRNTIPGQERRSRSPSPYVAPKADRVQRTPATQATNRRQTPYGAAPAVKKEEVKVKTVSNPSACLF